MHSDCPRAAGMGSAAVAPEAATKQIKSNFQHDPNQSVLFATSVLMWQRRGAGGVP